MGTDKKGVFYMIFFIRDAIMVLKDCMTLEVELHTIPTSRVLPQLSTIILSLKDSLFICVVPM